MKIWKYLRTRNVKFGCNTLSLCCNSFCCCVVYCSCWGNFDIIISNLWGREIYETLFTGIDRPLDFSKWWPVLFTLHLASYPGHSQILSCSCGEKSGIGLLGIWDYSTLKIQEVHVWNVNSNTGMYVGVSWCILHMLHCEITKWNGPQFLIDLILLIHCINNQRITSPLKKGLDVM